MQIKRNLIFSLEKRKKKDQIIIENVPIRLRINYDGTRLDIQTGYRIDVAKWNDEKEQVRNGSFNKLGQSSASINSRLLELKVAIQDLFQEFESQDKIPTKDEIRHIAKSLKEKGKVGAEKISDSSFFEVFDKFVKENSRLNNWSSATITKFSAVKNHITSFNSNSKFEDFDESGLTDYLIHLRTKRSMRNSTIKKQLGFIKWFLRWGFEKKYHSNDAYQAFRPKIKDSNKTVIFLTEEEKTKIINYEIPISKAYLDRVRDVLMFCCYTGLRYSDVYNLKRSDIKPSHFQITTVKTSDSLIIEFNKHSRAILKKYEHLPYEHDKALPVISNQKMNDYLKELGRLAEIDTSVTQTYYIGNKRIDETLPKHELFGTHIGRRTFICSALSIGIPVQVVMKWTGHSDYKAMKPYIDVADKTKKNAMEKFDML
ncbi:tyrosine-type recombinase/integrase [Mesonia ostreae]|uniref:Phage integrase SAM-like domain-containing protein n=1 Tax=Mesonia ostreae TaxID=861110 RepID=A0ABU2KKI8_9FLAO|nr:tyrosine-type recombinase/integrase [Mesonia ostreae]MDT0295184.1 phage integrase SAM-like domain-containing protein [Mesonia ostreae]